jgi:spore coat polysaccharide biosynthesis protein SpsF
MKIAAIVESRMSSKRLPGKNLKPILGEPMLARLLERLKRSEMITDICIATSTHPSDAALEELARVKSVKCFRGSLEDVLDRTLQAAKSVEADILVEITGDCPLVDRTIVDAAIRRYLKGDCDYVANILDRLSFSIGFDVQVYSVGLLEEISTLAKDPYDRNNVTPFIYRNPTRYRLLNLFAPPELDRPKYFLCVDYLSDFQVITAIYEALYPKDPAFGAREIVQFIDGRPEIASLNYRADAFAFPSSGGAAQQEMLAFGR